MSNQNEKANALRKRESENLMLSIATKLESEQDVGDDMISYANTYIERYINDSDDLEILFKYADCAIELNICCNCDPFDSKKLMKEIAERGQLEGFLEYFKGENSEYDGSIIDEKYYAAAVKLARELAEA